MNATAESKIASRLDKYEVGRKAHAMRPINGFVLSVALVCGLMLQSCSPQSQTDAPVNRAVNLKEFSAADKQAARALSLGNSQDILTEQSDYSRSLLCEVSLRFLEKRLGSSAVLTDEMKAELQKLNTNYAEKVNQLGKQQGKTDEAIRSDRANAASRQQSAQILARTAMGCIQALEPQNAGQ